jgi:hypothetical protein
VDALDALGSMKLLLHALMPTGGEDAGYRRRVVRNPVAALSGVRCLQFIRQQALREPLVLDVLPSGGLR